MPSHIGEDPLSLIVQKFIRSLGRNLQAIFPLLYERSINFHILFLHVPILTMGPFMCQPIIEHFYIFMYQRSGLIH